jgi:fucose permease
VISDSLVKRVVPVLAALAFVSLGLPDGLLGVAWPSLRASFGLELDALGALLVAATLGYVASSFSSGRLLGRINLGTVLAVSCGLTAAALLGYASASSWLVMLALGAVLGLGSGAIDAALNTYVATHHGPRMLNWLHACFGVGAASGPLVMTAVLESGSTWRRGYAIVGLAQLALAGCFVATFRAWPRSDGAGAAAEPTRSETTLSTLRVRGAWLGIAAFFVYSGVEASIGAWTYTLLTEARRVPAVEAGLLVSVYWGSLTGGRLLAAVAGGLADVESILRVAVCGVAIGVAIVWLNAGTAWTWLGLMLAGVGSGPIFPSLVATTPARFGHRHAANAVGFQIAASAVGLSVLPGLVGVAADAFGVESIARLVAALALLLVIVYGVLDRVAPVGREMRPSAAK